MGKRTGPKTVLSMRIDADLMDRLHAIAETDYRTLSGLVHMIFNDYLDGRLADEKVVPLPLKKTNR